MVTKNLQENKKVPILRFGDFNGDWASSKLSGFTSIYDGTHQTPEYVKEGVPFYSVEHLTANDFSSTKFIASSVFEKENKKIKLEKGDILMTRIGDIGTARLIDWDVKASFYVSLALIKKTEKINSIFIAQYINSNNFQRELWKRTIHVAFPKKINLGEIGECEVFVPIFKEQEKIASFLGAVDEWIENLKEQKENLELYKKGMMQKIFSQEIRFKDDDGKDFPEWEEKPLKEIVEFWNGKAHEQEISEEGKYIVINSKFISTNGEVQKYSHSQISPLRKGDIAIVMSDVPNGKAIGKCFLVDKDNTYTLNQRIGGIRSKEIISSFLIRILNRNKYFLEFDNGVSQTNLRKDEVLGCPLIFPSIKEQQKIANFLNSIDEVIESKQQQISKAEEWKKGLIQGLFV